jgi:hypothetical protein
VISLSRRLATGSLAIAVLAALPAACSRRALQAPTTETTTTAAGVPTQIYFPGTDDRLHGEPHTISPSLATPEQRLRALAQAWIDGPQSESLVRPLQAVESVHVDLTDAGTLYVDLLSAPDATKPQLGSSEELTAIYSLVNTFALNVPEVKAVVLLWNGTQPPTLAGHIDAGVPMTANSALIAGRAASR